VFATPRWCLGSAHLPGRVTSDVRDVSEDRPSGRRVVPLTAQADGGEAYYGHEGVRRWWSNLVGNVDEFEASVSSVGT
jgi:hypothetical protein